MRFQIPILNGASTVGRVLPTAFVRQLGVFNLVVFCLTMAAILVFCTLVVKDVVGTMIFAIMYGFFSGACMFNPLLYLLIY